MSRHSIVFSDEIAYALEAYAAAQDTPTALNSVAEDAVREFLTVRGYLPGGRFAITPANSGSGMTDTSIAHDRSFCEP